MENRLNNFFYCFIHIEKCAGTTLHHCLKYNFPGYLTLKPWYYWANADGNYLKSSELNCINKMMPILQGIGGHTPRTYAGYEKVIARPIKYFTFIRNPIQRYLSHFNHQVNKMDKHWNFESFSSDERFNNWITVRIAGKPDLSLAKERIKKDFDFVGLTEKYDESLLLLQQYVFDNNLTLFYEHKNDSENESKISFNDLSHEMKNRALINNKLDLKLYEYVEKKLYPNFINKYKGDLNKALEQFKEKNQSYCYKKMRYYLINSTRVITENFIEKLAHIKYAKN